MRTALVLIALALAAVWPLRAVAGALPDGLLGTEVGVWLPLHLLAEAMAAALCLWYALSTNGHRGSPRPYRGGRRSHRGVALLAVGALTYAGLNGLAPGLYGNGWYLLTAVLQLVAAGLIVAAGRRHPPDSRRAGPQGLRSPRWPAWALGLVGLGMLAFWSLHTLSGGLPQGFLTVENEAYIALHIGAEVVAGLAALAAAAGLALRSAGGVPAGLFAAGAVLYSTVNSLGWGLQNDPALAIVFLVSGLLALAVAVSLSARAGSSLE